MSEPTERMPAYGGFILGVALTLVAFEFIFFIFLSPRKTALLWRTDTGVTCHVDRLYPKADCAALLADLGPRLSIVKALR